VFESEVTVRLTRAVSQAIARTTLGEASWHVCVRTPDDDEILFSFRLGTYKEVERLAREISDLGYQLKLMHPVHTKCDFVLEPAV
jgi:hypothetical protein